MSMSRQFFLRGLAAALLMTLAPGCIITVDDGNDDVGTESSESESSSADDGGWKIGCPCSSCDGAFRPGAVAGAGAGAATDTGIEMGRPAYAPADSGASVDGTT